MYLQLFISNFKALNMCMENIFKVKITQLTSFWEILTFGELTVLHCLAAYSSYMYVVNICKNFCFRNLMFTVRLYSTSSFDCSFFKHLSNLDLENMLA